MNSYKFKYTERNVSKASEYETRALLFLISFSSIKDSVHYVFIDCFNDVSGTQKKCEELFDIQAKGVAKLPPGKVGSSLITLFENYLSKINFSNFILFVQSIDSKYLVNKAVFSFGISNFGLNEIKIKKGLLKEYLRRNPKGKGDSQLEFRVSLFLSLVIFVIDNKTKSEYVKSLTSFKNKELKEDVFFEIIFKEIQEKQLAKKIINVENKEILAIKETLSFEKHISVSEIHALLVNRLIGVNVFKKSSIPLPFFEVIKKLSTEEAIDLVQDCNSKLSKAFFDKNSKKSIWEFIEYAITYVQESPASGAVEIHEKIERKHGIKSRYFKNKAGVYLISLIQEGLSENIN